MKTWNTSLLAASQQFGYWREVLCEAFTALDSVPRAQGGYGSKVILHELAETNAVELASFAQQVDRGHKEIRRRGDHYFFANLQLDGRCGVTQDGRQIAIAPGAFYVVDTTRPYRLDFIDDFRALSFRIPHHQLAPLIGKPAAFTAVAVDASSGIGGLAINHMHGIMRCAPGLTADAAAAASATLAHLISVALSGTAAAKESSRSEARRALRQSIVQYVQAHAGNPELSVSAVAARFRVSCRYVHETFAAEPHSFAQTVLDLRLAAAAARLLQPGESITTVALQCGFGDPSYFGRVFRSRYGCSPRNWRHEKAQPS